MTDEMPCPGYVIDPLQDRWGAPEASLLLGLVVGRYGMLYRLFKTRNYVQLQIPLHKGLLVMLMMRVIVTIRTGRCAPLSTPRLARVPATGLAQNHPPPEIAR